MKNKDKTIKGYEPFPFPKPQESIEKPQIEKPKPPQPKPESPKPKQ